MALGERVEARLTVDQIARPVLAWRVLCALERFPARRDVADRALSELRTVRDEWTEFAEAFATELDPEYYGRAEPVWTDTSHTGRDAPGPAQVWAEVRIVAPDDASRAEILIPSPPEALPAHWRARMKLAVAEYCGRGEAAPEPSPHRDQETERRTQLRKCLRDLDALAELDAMRDDAHSTSLHYARSGILHALREHVAAEKEAQSAVTLAPNVAAPRQRLWRIVAESSELERDTRAARILEDLATYLARTDVSDSDRAAASYSAAYHARQLGEHEAADRIQTNILSAHPASVEAEWVITETCRKRFREFVKAPRQSASRREAAASFFEAADLLLGEPASDPALLGEALTHAVMVRAREDDFDNDRLARAADAFLKVPNHRISHYLTVAREVWKAGIDIDRARRIIAAGRSTASREPDDERRSDFNAALALLAVSVELAGGDFGAAKTALADARGRPFAHDEVDLLAAEARIALAMEDTDTAADVLARCSHAEVCSDILPALHSRVAPSKSFETWKAALVREGRKVRRESALKTRLMPSRDIPSLAALGLGHEASGAGGALAATGARPIVIKFFTETCGACTSEFSRFADFADRAKDGVTFVVAIQDEDPSESEAFLEKNRWTGTTVHSPTYLRLAGVSTFPTTWFVDRSGKLAFEIVGPTAHLEEEYTWRLEALRR